MAAGKRLTEKAPTMADEILLFSSADLVNSGEAAPFDVIFCSQTSQDFSIVCHTRRHV